MGRGSAVQHFGAIDHFLGYCCYGGSWPLATRLYLATAPRVIDGFFSNLVHMVGYWVRKCCTLFFYVKSVSMATVFG